jgi:Icc protein
MAWAGTGVVWVMSGGVLSSSQLVAGAKRKGSFSFVQISDSHIGFNKDPNHDVTKTFEEAVNKINALDDQPAFLLHTGDITQLAQPEQFDTASQVLKTSRASQVYYVPGEHDVFSDDGNMYLERFGRGTQGKGWQSFDYNGVHFIGLINVLNLKQGSGTGLGGTGFGQLGRSSWRGWRRTSRASRAARRWLSLRTFRCGPFTLNGVGALTTARKHSLI